MREAGVSRRGSREMKLGVVKAAAPPHKSRTHQHSNQHQLNVSLLHLTPTPRGICLLAAPSSTITHSQPRYWTLRSSSNSTNSTLAPRSQPTLSATSNDTFTKQFLMHRLPMKWPNVAAIVAKKPTRVLRDAWPQRHLVVSLVERMLRVLRRMSYNVS